MVLDASNLVDHLSLRSLIILPILGASSSPFLVCKIWSSNCLSFAKFSSSSPLKVLNASSNPKSSRICRSVWVLVPTGSVGSMNEVSSCSLLILVMVLSTLLATFDSSFIGIFSRLSVSATVEY